MLCSQTQRKLFELKLHGIAAALKEQMESSQYEELGFLDRLSLLLDRELTLRENRKLQRLLNGAKLRQQACIEDVDFQVPRNLDKTLVLSLASCEWIAKGHNLLVTGPTGVGKSYLACALGHQCCLHGKKVLYFRMSAFLRELKDRRDRGEFIKLQKQLLKTSLLILDDFGLQELKQQERMDFLDILDDRANRLSTIIVTQVPINHWHELIGESTIADAILDRFIHNAYQIQMKGESMRKKKKRSG